MLVLSRRVNEKVLFPSIPASVEVVSVRSGAVRLGIQAPDEVTVFRQEVWDRVLQPNGGETADGAKPHRAPSDLDPLLNDLDVLIADLLLLRRRLQVQNAAPPARITAGVPEELRQQLLHLPAVS